MRVRIESCHRQVQVDVTADAGRLKVAVKAGSKKGQTHVPTWGEAERIIVSALRKLRMDDALDAQG